VHSDVALYGGPKNYEKRAPGGLSGSIEARRMTSFLQDSLIAGNAMRAQYISEELK
jgi:hypothetical protein